MSKADDITLEEWYAEMERLHQLDTVGGVTVAEMSEKTGHSVLWLQRKIRVLMNRGEWTCLGRKAVTSIDGRAYTSPVYGPAKGKGKKK